MQYESAGKRRDGSISREGSVALRRALIDLGIGLWLTEPAAKAYAAELKTAASTVASSPARWRIAPLASPTRWSATTPSTIQPAGPESPHDALFERSRSDCTLHNSRRQCHAQWTDEGPEQMPRRLWRTHWGYAAPNLAPDPSPPRQPERRQMTHTSRSHKSTWAPGTRHTSQARRHHSSTNAPQPRMPIHHAHSMP